MPGPQISDNGATVEVDLHGLRIDEAVRLVRAVLGEAARRGRTSVKLIHGSSTSSAAYRNRTIKHELYDLLDAGALGGYVTGDWRAEDYVIVSLRLPSIQDPRPIRLLDLSF